MIPLKALHGGFVQISHLDTLTNEGLIERPN